METNNAPISEYPRMGKRRRPVRTEEALNHMPVVTTGTYEEKISSILNLMMPDDDEFLSA